MTRSLRASLIRLAHQKPEFRNHLLPLLGKTADSGVFDANSVWQVREDKGEIVIWQVQKGSHFEKVNRPKLLGTYTSAGAANTAAKEEKAKSKKTANAVQDRINKALRETGLWDMRGLAKHLRAQGDDEAAEMLESRDEADKIRVQSPAFRFIDKVRKDISAEATERLQEPWTVGHGDEGGDEITVHFNSREPKSVATLQVDDHGKIKVKSVDKAEWAKLQKMLKGPYASIVGPKLDALASYLKKHGGRV